MNPKQRAAIRVKTLETSTSPSSCAGDDVDVWATATARGSRAALDSRRRGHG